MFTFTPTSLYKEFQYEAFVGVGYIALLHLFA